MLKIPLTGHLNNKELFRKIGTKRTFVLRARKTVEILGHIRKVCLENLTLSGYIEDRDRKIASKLNNNLV